MKFKENQGRRTSLGSRGLSPGTFSDLLNGSFSQIAQKCNKNALEKKVPPHSPGTFSLGASPPDGFCYFYSECRENYELKFFYEKKYDDELRCKFKFDSTSKIATYLFFTFSSSASKVRILNKF